MLIGELLFNQPTTPVEPVYTGTISRGGNSANFYVDVIQRSGSATLEIDIEHKNFNEDDWTTAGSIGPISATGLTAKVTANNLREEIRLKVEVTGGTGAWMRVLFLPPVWID